MTLPIDLAKVRAAASRIAPFVRATPLLASAILTERAGVPVYLKAESLQSGGSFKVRGASNAVACAIERNGPLNGIVTYSSGNHAQGCALAARNHHIPAIVVMPVDAPKVKIEAARGYGAKVHFAGFTSEERRVEAEALAREYRYQMIPPFDDPDVVAGQATVGLEIVRDLPGVGTIIVPCGGGGLVAGVALAATETRRSIRVVSAEPEAAAKLARSLSAGAILPEDPGPTIADGLRPVAPGAIPFAIARERLAAAAIVNDTEIEHAVMLLLARARLVVEPSGAAGVAALCAGRAGKLTGPCVVVLSGGNLDPRLLTAWLQKRQL